jgi:hypothetical protein
MTAVMSAPLRSAYRQDSALEFSTEFAPMPTVRVRDDSWHGFLPQKLRRMSLQLCNVDSDWREQYMRHSIIAYEKSVPFLRKVVDLTPSQTPWVP